MVFLFLTDCQQVRHWRQEKPKVCARQGLHGWLVRPVPTLEKYQPLLLQVRTKSNNFDARFWSSPLQFSEISSRSLGMIWSVPPSTHGPWTPRREAKTASKYKRWRKGKRPTVNRRWGPLRYDNISIQAMSSGSESHLFAAYGYHFTIHTFLDVSIQVIIIT